MPSLAQGTGYATLALGYIASAAGKPVLVRAVAQSCDLPAPYLSKIINRLARAGLVNTQRGVNGGVVLARDATDITLRDVCVALDDPVIAKRCLLGTEVCSDERACPAHKFSTQIREKMLDYLNKTTIADIAAFELKKRWADAVKASQGSTELTVLAKPRSDKPEADHRNGENGHSGHEHSRSGSTNGDGKAEHARRGTQNGDGDHTSRP